MGQNIATYFYSELYLLIKKKSQFSWGHLSLGGETMAHVHFLVLHYCRNVQVRAVLYGLKVLVNIRINASN